MKSTASIHLRKWLQGLWTTSSSRALEFTHTHKLIIRPTQPNSNFIFNVKINKSINQYSPLVLKQRINYIKTTLIITLCLIVAIIIRLIYKRYYKMKKNRSLHITPTDTVDTIHYSNPPLHNYDQSTFDPSYLQIPTFHSLPLVDTET